MPPVSSRHCRFRLRPATLLASMLFAVAGLREDAGSGGASGEGFARSAACSFAARAGARRGAALKACFACSPSIQACFTGF